MSMVIVIYTLKIFVFTEIVKMIKRFTTIRKIMIKIFVYLN